MLVSARATGNAVSRWWRTLSSRGRERVILGATLAGAVAARDLVLLGGAALTMAALEFADRFALGANARAPAA